MRPPNPICLLPPFPTFPVDRLAIAGFPPFCGPTESLPFPLSSDAFVFHFGTWTLSPSRFHPHWVLLGRSLPPLSLHLGLSPSDTPLTSPLFLSRLFFIFQLFRGANLLPCLDCSCPGSLPFPRNTDPPTFTFKQCSLRSPPPPFFHCPENFCSCSFPPFAFRRRFSLGRLFHLRLIVRPTSWTPFFSGSARVLFLVPLSRRLVKK